MNTCLVYSPVSGSLREKYLRLALILAGFFGAAPFHASAGAAAVLEINPPLGPFIQSAIGDFNGALNFTITNRLVVTPYFYWYDVYSQSHIVNPDGSDALTDHPASLTGFSCFSTAWHKTQLRDMTDAAIDILLPVYWGEPSQRLPGQPVATQPWSYAGIPPLVRAREELLAEGIQPPAIGLFYDTSSLQFNAAQKRIDLTTAYGRQWFYESVRDFFSLIPARHWARIDGKPVVFLYSAAFASNYDQSCIDYLRGSFARDFGGNPPYIVREISWSVKTEQVYAWGGALGLKNPGVASIGPGYNHSAVPGRDPLVVSREGGAFFDRTWQRFLSQPSPMVFVETWNEFHEGTDIANSREYGRQFIELNRKYAELFKKGIAPAHPSGPFTGSHLAQIILQAANLESGLRQFEQADGATAASNMGALACREVSSTPYAGHYVYFQIDDSFKWADSMYVSVIVDYFDAIQSSLRLEYDGSDTSAPFQGAYTVCPETEMLRGTKTWRVAVFSLPAARFRNQQNGNADFRINCSALGVGIRRVQVIRPGLRADGFNAEKAFKSTLFAEPGRLYIIESSENLVDWTTLERRRITDTTSFFTDEAAQRFTWHWYRARRQ